MPPDDTTHRSFVPRLWRANPRQHWQAILFSLANPEQRQHFASLDALAAYLLVHDHRQHDTAATVRQP